MPTEVAAILGGIGLLGIVLILIFGRGKGGGGRNDW